jgi:cell pole-organizing protein PopZ
MSLLQFAGGGLADGGQQLADRQFSLARQKRTGAPMTETPPESPPPTGHLSFLDHVKAWYARDVAPDLADARIKAENAAELAGQLQAWLHDHAANAETIASLVARIAAAADPSAAPAIAALVTEAERAAAEAARIAQETSEARL